jgi:hypothetical protein
VAQQFALGCYTFIKPTFIIILSGLLLCGCSQKPAVATSQVKDFVQAGRDITCNGGSFILHVVKRDGDLLSGIRCLRNPGQQGEEVITAGTGKLGFVGPEDGKVLMLTLLSPNSQDPKTSTSKVVIFALKEFVVNE